MEKTKQDLRVKKTIGLIQSTFYDMMNEMDYSDITVKELTMRAQINRKTFYLHYETIDALLLEIQENIVKAFLAKTKNLDTLHDIDKLTKEFFLFCSTQDPLSQKIICTKDYSHLCRQISDKIMEKRRSVTSLNSLDKTTGDIVVVFLTSTTLELFRYWVLTGKKVDLDRMVAISSTLINNGIKGLLTQSL